MDKRTSRVAAVKLNSLVDGSIFEIGDGEEFTPYGRALAVQKEGGGFSTSDFPFSDFPIFYEDLPYFDKQIVIDQDHIACSPYIDVQSVDIQAISSASLFQIGNLDYIHAESRIKHIRILLDKDDEETDEQ